MNVPLNEAQINAIILSDRGFPLNMGSLYAPEIMGTLTSHWPESRTDIQISHQHQFCSQFQYRFLKLPPQPSMNYYPRLLGDHLTLMKFLHGILISRFHGTAVLVNMSPSLITTEGNTAYFLYASRGNFGAFQNAHLIHSVASRNAFLQRVASFNFHNYLQNCITTISRKYSGPTYAINMVFHFTQAIHQVFAGVATASHLKRSNMCLWHSLTHEFCVLKGNLIRLEKKKNKGVLQMAYKLRSHFLTWLQKNHPHEPSPITKRGFEETKLDLLESYLQCSIFVYKRKTVRMLKRKRNQIVEFKDKKINYFTLHRKPSFTYEKAVLLLNSKKDHVNVMPNVNTYCKKHVCDNCNSTFWSKYHLNRHTEKCISKNRFLSNKLTLQTPTLPLLIKETSPDFDDVKASIDDYAIISLIHNGNSITMDLMIISLGTASQSHYILPSVSDCVQQAFTYLIDSALQTVSKRQQKNENFINQLQQAIEGIQNDLELKPCYEDKLKYRKLLDIQNRLQNFFRTLNCMVVTKLDQKNLGNEFFHGILIHSLTHKLGKPEFKYTKSILTQIDLPSKNLQFSYATANCAAFNLDQSFNNTCKNIHNIIQNIHEILDINIVMEGNLLSPTAIGKQYFYGLLDNITKLSLYSPSHELYLHVCKSVKFGLLGATKTIISEKSFYSSAISLDFSKMYLNTIKNMSNPPLSITLKYEKLGSSYWCDSNQRRHCYSNLIISFMNHIFTSSFCCALNGKEIYVNNYPVDAIIFHPDETKSTFQFCKY